MSDFLVSLVGRFIAVFFITGAYMFAIFILSKALSC